MDSYHCWLQLSSLLLTIFEASANYNRTKVDFKCTEQIYTQTQRQSTEEEEEEEEKEEEKEKEEKEEERECFLRPPIAFQINTPGRSPRSCWEAQAFVILALQVL